MAEETPSLSQFLSTLPSPQDITTNLAPLTAAETAKTMASGTPSLGQSTIPKKLSADEQFRLDNTRTNAPLVLNSTELTGALPDQGDLAPGTGAAPESPFGLTSPMFRFQMARRTGLESQLKYAKTKLGDENARLSKDGKEVIVTIPNPDEPGKNMDVPVNERDMTLNDFTALAAHIPEFAGAVLGLAAARAGRPEGARGLVNFIKDIVGGSVGQEAAGGLAEAGTRLQDQEIVNPGQITMDKAKSLIPDIGIGLLGGAVGEAVLGASRFVQAPFSAARTETQTLGIAATERLNRELGLGLGLTAGQASGSAPVIMGEAFLGAHPSGQRIIAPLFEKQAADKKALLDALTAGGGTDEEAGKELLARLQSTRNAQELALQGSKERLAERSQQAIEQGLGKGATEITPVSGGEALRTEIMAKHGEVIAKNRANYTEAYQVPGATDPIVPTEGITGAIKDIKLPMRTVERQTPSSLVDEFGRGGTTTTTSREPVSEFLHPEVEQFLGTKLDPKMPIQEVVQMRDMLWDEIQRGEAVKGIPTKQLTQIARSMTEAIDEGIASLPASSPLKAKLATANKYYKENVLKFEEAGIADIFKDIKDPGFKESSAIIERLAQDPAKFQRTIALLGTNSKGANTVRQFIRDDLIRRSASDLDPTRMEASRFLANLRDMRVNQPDIYKDVIGARGENLLESAAGLGAAQGSISLKEAEQALTGKQSIMGIQDLVTKQRKVDELAVNQLIKSYTSGKLDINTINPEQVVNGFMTTGTRSQIEHLMDGIRHENPAAAKRIERKMTEKFLTDAGGLKATDKTLGEIFNNKEVMAKYEAVLGHTQMNLLRDVAAYLAPIRYAAGVAGGTGMLVKGSAIGGFLKSLTSITNPTKELWDIASKRIAALAITNPIFRNWVTATPKELYPDLARAIVLTEPFVTALAEDIGDKSKLAQTVVQIRKAFSLGKTTNQAPTQGQHRTQPSISEFMKSIQP